MITYTTTAGRTITLIDAKAATENNPLFVFFKTSEWSENQDKFVMVYSGDHDQWGLGVTGDLEEVDENKIQDHMECFDLHRSEILQHVTLLLAEVGGHA